MSEHSEQTLGSNLSFSQHPNVVAIAALAGMTTDKLFERALASCNPLRGWQRRPLIKAAPIDACRNHA